MHRTPPFNEVPENSRANDEELVSPHAKENEFLLPVDISKASYPSARLGSVTRKINEIKEILTLENPHRKTVKAYFSDCRKRMLNFVDECMFFLEDPKYTEKSKNDLRAWYSGHRNVMDLFENQVRRWLTESKDMNSESSSSSVSKSVGSHTSKVSAARTVGSIRIKLAEEAASLKADEHSLRQHEKIDQLKMKLGIEQRKSDLDKRRVYVQTLKDEIEKIDPLETDFPLETNSENPLKLHLKELAAVGPIQNPYFDYQTKTDLNPLGEQFKPAVRQRLPPVVETFELENPQETQKPPQTTTLFAEETPKAPLRFSQENTEGPAVDEIQVINLLLKSQQKALLPKCEPTCFDGSDATLFYEFIFAFRSMIADKCDNDVDRFAYLTRYTSGLALQIVRSCRIVRNPSASYKIAMQKLEVEFGNEFKISNSYLEKLSNWPIIKNEDGPALQQFAIFLADTENQMAYITSLNQLNSPAELRRIISILPYKLKDRWRNYVADSMKQCRSVCFSNLVHFVQRQSEVANLPLYSDIAESRKVSDSTSKNDKSNFKNRVLNTSIDQSETPGKPKNCTFCLKEGHSIAKCFKFAKLSLDDRMKIIKEKKLCYRCLGEYHAIAKCHSRVKCEICQKQHHTLVHRDPKSIVNKQQSQNSLQSEDVNVAEKEQGQSPSKMALVGNHSGDGGERIVYTAVPVKIRMIGTKEFETTYMALDQQCNGVFMNEKLATRLGVKLMDEVIPLTTMHHSKKLTKTRILNHVEIYDLDENERATFPVVYCQTQWPFAKEDSPNPEDLERLPHFSHLPFRYLSEGKSIELLIGNNYPNIIRPHQIIDGPTDMDAYVTTHKFGISLNGPVCSSMKDSLKCNRIKLEDVFNENELFAAFCDQEFKSDANILSPSIEDLKWEKIVKESLKKTPNGHYEVDLPLRNECVALPNNREQVLQRLHALKRRMLRDVDFKNEYTLFMNEMMHCGFAERVPPEDLSHSGCCWYLVHFGIRHKQKRKLRVVFDASLRFHGICLNDLLLQGPDLSSSLIGVLLRFRQDPVAFTGDIRKMFYQVQVPIKHRDYLRFFWHPDGNLDSEPVEFRVTVHLFGAVSSPSIANYVLKNTVNSEKAGEFSKQTLETILKHFYVDDLLRSSANEVEAIRLLKEVCELVKEAGFELTGFASNSRAVLDSVPVEDLSKAIRSLDLSREDLPIELALGLSWKTDSDVIGYKVKLPETKLTKRGLLQTIFSIYDPLGLAAPAILPAKLMFQKSCKEGVAWDDPLPSDLVDDLENWTSNILSLSDFVIQRCYRPLEDFNRVEMHIFCDGSMISFAAVCYLRFVHEERVISCRIVTSKSRLVPLRQKPTIPRIELSSAKLAVTVGETVQRELQFNVAAVFYWTDSTTVLKYLRNENRRFQRFVANRIAYIRDHSNLDHWSHVPGILNPADLACRGTLKIDDLCSTFWKNGPPFLMCSDDQWPKEPFELKDKNIDFNDPELVKEKKILATKQVSNTPTDVLLESSSNLMKIIFRIAWFRRFGCWLRDRKSAMEPLSTKEVEEAEKSIWSYVQHVAYPESIKFLSRASNSVCGQSLRAALNRERLHKLHPYFDDGLLRVGGRLNHASIAEETKHPIVLPKEHKVVQALVRGTHTRFGHLGKERMLVELRKKFWIVGANVLCRSIVRNCIICRKRQGRPAMQLMANLPHDRLESDVPVFSNIGLDAFGHFFVTRGRGRTQEKRWGIIFTCLVSRAIHIEMVYSLDTSSFIDALRRFIARRGMPNIIRSDNGTNFVGANKELTESLDAWNSKQSREWMLQHNISWHFQPPSGSHFGGVFERLIRSIRHVMNGLLKEQPLKLNDEGLSTLFAEIEAILNGRPLIPISNDPNDLEAITPNHLLLSRSGSTFPPGLFSRDDCFVRKKWRQVQYLADLFWKRWKSEYLPLLQERQKWHHEVTPLKIDDLVLVVDNLAPRNQWNLGRIMKTYPDKDGNVRIADVRIAKNHMNATEIRRPLSKLIILSSNNDLL